MMGGLFSQFGSAQRVGFGLALFALSTLLAWLSLRFAVAGPWYGSSLTLFAAAASMTVGFSAWPDKLPAEVLVLKEKWDKAKAKSTKSAQGRFVWNVGRSAMAAMIAYQVIPVDIDGGFMRFAFIAGFGLSAGFFGARAMLWSALLVFLTAHRTALSGLNVDFSNPTSREQLWIMWGQGASMSWWWAVGLGLCPLLWIGSSGLMVKLGNQIAEELAERQAAAIAKKKIDARRERLRSQRDADATDPVSLASQETERAKKRASSVSGRDIGINDLSKSKDGDSKELRGVAKIEHDRNEILLRNYAAYARTVMNSEKIGISADTKNRRAFDRVIEALPDSSLAHLRASSWDGASDLLGYYNRLCGTVQEAMTGGDGEIVSAGPGSDEDALPTLHAAPLVQADEVVEGSGIVDVLDSPPEAISTMFSSRAAVGEGALKMMLSEASDSPDAVSFGDESEGAEYMSEDANASASSFGADVLEATSTFTPLQINDHGIMGEGSETSDHADGAAPEAGAEEISTPTTAEAAADRDIDAAVEGEQVVTEGVVTSPQVLIVEGSQVEEVDAEQLRRFAGSIVMGKADREIVMESLGCFEDVASLASAIGLPAEMVGEQFATYDRMAGAARTETELLSLLESDGPDENAVRAAVAGLVAASDCWPTDLLGRGEAWVAQKDSEASARAAETARLEELRLQEQRELEEQAQRDREAAEKEAEEAAEREAEAARLAAEKTAAEEAERATKEAEEARLAALQGQKSHYASRILVGHIDDDVLEAGMTLFPTVDAYAEGSSLPIEMVEGRYEEFRRKWNAKSKFDELREAMKDEANLDLVQALIASPESFEGYVDSSLTLDDALKWVDGVEVKQRVVGLADGGIKTPAPAGEDMRKLFMKKRLGTPDDIIELIEKKLPEALMLERQLGGVIALMPSVDEVMVSHRARAAADAANIAARLVEAEKVCKEYAMAFFPAEARVEGMLFWDMILDLASKAGEFVEEAPPAAPRAEKPKAASQAGALSKPIAFASGIKSEEEVQALDPLQEIKEMTFGPIKTREDMERQYGLSYKPMFERDPETESSDNGKTFSVSLGEAHGHGKIAFFTNLEWVPLWYSESADKIYARSSENGQLRTQSAEEMFKRFAAIAKRHTHENERVRGIIMISPHITEEGEMSFAPLIRKFHNCPLIILNNQRLNGAVFRALVEKIKGDI
jgi:hypothetical protein